MRTFRSEPEQTVGTKPVLLCLWAALCLVSAGVTAVYLRINPPALVGTLLAVLMLCSIRRLQKRKLSAKEWTAMAAFAAVIALVLVVGYHIHVEDGYAGTIEQNYITPFAVRDGLNLLVMTLGLSALFSAAYSLCASAQCADFCAYDASGRWKRWGILALVLFACWLPYLLAWWPGIILGDTRRSMLQVMDFESLYNFQPVMYTLFIKLWVKIGQALFHSSTAGYALYTLVQMAYVSLCLAFVINWAWRHGGISRVGAVLLTAVFGLSPYFASLSVAGWKDPIFSASIALLSVLLLDEAIHPEKQKSAGRYAVYAGLLLVIAFFRNNGIALLVCLGGWLGLQLLAQLWRKQPASIRMLALVLAVVMTFFVVSGPVYNRLGIWKDKREANALVLQQMARTVVMDGEMSEHGEYYMHMLLPLDRYETTYRPCCVDLLKWDEQFDFTVIDRQMYIHWLHMLLHNPRIFVEAWLLNSFGFWTLNVPLVNTETKNLSMGSIQNTDPAAVEWFRDACGITFENLLGSEKARDVFAVDAWIMPIGWMFWGVVFLALCMMLKGQGRCLIALVPTFGLMLPIIIATPIYYWIRYATALHYLIPLYILLFRARIISKEEAQ